MLRIEASPKKIATSFAVGVFIGFSPFFGFHTLLGLSAAYVLRLSRLATVTGVFITNPISLVPIYTFCIWLGMIIMGMDVTEVINHIDWKSMTIANMATELESFIYPLFLGTFISGVVGGVISYYLVRAYVQRERWEEDTWMFSDDAESSSESSTKSFDKSFGKSSGETSTKSSDDSSKGGDN
jgi:hypothetical protein